ncbi:hypothetical protein ITP53_03390 [Nonomuraea sp. K274]|uniref:Uncharacterized protein n=1 Tax=Nonomuraea cypriaca TaxID=1187855 RepID=A0A931A4D3_9ACTN|nr:hypothetical protein [Nonomuraea cypriaca]MBF8184800.1 hypothetical protein [Nonomuraea cypriaca]
MDTDDRHRLLAHAAGQGAMLAAECLAELRDRLQHLARRTSNTPAPGLTSPPVIVHDAAWAAEAARWRALAHEAAADTHQSTARQHDACAERGIGDIDKHRRRAAWHRRAAERERKTALALAAGTDRPTGNAPPA